MVELVEPGSEVLVLGCWSGFLEGLLRAKGCQVTQVDLLLAEAAPDGLEQYTHADPTRLAELKVGRAFDYVILLDGVEHLLEPERFLIYLRRHLKEDGALVVAIPNIALFVYRGLLLAGRFEYADRGVLDRAHVRHYTLPSARNLLRSSGFEVFQERRTPIPFHLVIPARRGRRVLDLLTRCYEMIARLWPRMFAYENVFAARVVRLEWDELRKLPIRMEEPHPHLPGAERPTGGP